MNIPEERYEEKQGNRDDDPSHPEEKTVKGTWVKPASITGDQVQKECKPTQDSTAHTRGKNKGVRVSEVKQMGRIDHTGGSRPGENERGIEKGDRQADKNPAS